MSSTSADSTGRFRDDGYVIVRGLLARPVRSFLHAYALKSARAGRLKSDGPQVPGTPYSYGDPLMEAVLEMLVREDRRRNGTGPLPDVFVLSCLRTGRRAAASHRPSGLRGERHPHCSAATGCGRYGSRSAAVPWPLNCSRGDCADLSRHSASPLEGNVHGDHAYRYSSTTSSATALTMSGSSTSGPACAHRRYPDRSSNDSWAPTVESRSLELVAGLDRRRAGHVGNLLSLVDASPFSRRRLHPPPLCGEPDRCRFSRLTTATLDPRDRRVSSTRCCSRD